MIVIAQCIKDILFFVVFFLILVSLPIGIVYLDNPKSIPDNSLAGMVISTLKGK